jgi:hypothetical protein
MSSVFKLKMAAVLSPTRTRKIENEIFDTMHPLRHENQHEGDISLSSFSLTWAEKLTEQSRKRKASLLKGAIQTPGGR